MLIHDRFRLGYSGSYDMLIWYLLLYTYGRTISQCTHNDNYPGGQPSLVSCLLLLYSHNFQTRLSQAVLLVTIFWHHSNTYFRVIMVTMIRIVPIPCTPYWKRYWLCQRLWYPRRHLIRHITPRYLVKSRWWETLPSPYMVLRLSKFPCTFNSFIFNLQRYS